MDDSKQKAQTIISKEFLNRIINMLKTTEESVTLTIDTTNETEKLLVDFLNLINRKLYWTLNKDNENPYSTYIKNINVNILKDYLILIAQADIDRLFLCKLYDFIWIAFGNHQSATKAYTGYIEIINSYDSFKKNYYLFNRCINLYLKLNNDELSFIFQKTLFRMIDLGKNDTTYFPYKILKISFEQNFLTPHQLIAPIEEKLEQSFEISHSDIFIDYAKLYEKVLFKKDNVNYSEKPCKIKKIISIRRKIADFYLSRVNDKSIPVFNKIDCIKSAISTLKGISKAENERAVLQQKLVELQKQSSDNMVNFSKKIDISDIIKKYEEVIKTLDNKELFYFFILGFHLYSYDELKENLFSKSTFPLFAFSSHIVDKNGKTKAILPNYADCIESKDDTLLSPYIEQEVVDLYTNSVNIGMPFILKHIKDNKEILNREIDNILESSVFVDEKRKKLLKMSLLAGFDYDFISAICILAPQVEHSIRMLAFQCGDSTTKINEDKTEEVLSLESLLKSPKLNDCVDEKLLFYIKTVFVSEYGFSIRNDIAHGLLDDDDFNNTSCFFAWWFTLRLCVEFSPIKKEYTHKLINKLKDLEDDSPKQKEK